MSATLHARAPAWRRLLRDPRAALGLVLVGLAVLASGVPFMLKYRETKTRGATARDADIHFSAKTSPEPGKHAVPDTRP